MTQRELVAQWRRNALLACKRGQGEPMAVERNWEFGQSHGIETCARELEAVLDAEAEALALQARKAAALDKLEAYLREQAVDLRVGSSGRARLIGPGGEQVAGCSDMLALAEVLPAARVAKAYNQKEETA